ncbi:relaxase/mobilization nuclease domain-containing protein [Chryseobacterium sp. Ch-15]|uniref:Relaxase/mobilization nuclease domain-containing protein n=1 Tax=Chryseobacterium muglaense TaxID=2893752 RepID=A0A9Q3UZ69_9FLAO|nr:relaxase/mobilization nuclease domain-containing protein [Chryseobacterium muglaense]MBD3906407.1 relaxase/mobilization nuclease domain-containing protein [Chryseobacterium muglaense]MCC9037092.1 relaxase/mobilization nuclease domain-containing protein [Chryseobacterium muglaense]MCM2556869.1 relaxase/mobilization nuclease domain-containing protein [Chryseobacterium muglaense]
MVISASTRNVSSRSIQYQQSDKEQSVEVCRNGLSGEKPKELFEEFKQVADLNKRTENKYVTAVISPPKEYSQNLSLNDWAKLAEDYLKKEGIGKDNQYLVHLHQSTDDKHLHIIANRIDYYGKNQVTSHNIGERASSHAEVLSKERSWKTAQEITREKKEEIKNVLLQEKGQSKSLRDLVDRMDNRGYIMQISENSTGLNGARIIPKADINMNPSVLEKVTKQGFKLSDIDPKLKIKEIALDLAKSIGKDRGMSM